MICWATLFCSMLRASCSAAFSLFCSAFDSFGFSCGAHWHTVRSKQMVFLA